MTNRRNNIRIQLSGIHADLRCARGGTCTGRVRDVSLNGIYIEELVDLPVRSRCEVQLRGWDKSAISFTGTIVRTDQRGAGIQFAGLDHTACEMLRTLMLYHAAAPEQTACLFDEDCP